MASRLVRPFQKNMKTIEERSKKKYLEEALYRNLLKDGCDENSVRVNLNAFLKSHKCAYKWEVGVCLKLLRERKLYGPAVKVLTYILNSTWLRNLKCIVFVLCFHVYEMILMDGVF